MLLFETETLKVAATVLTNLAQLIWQLQQVAVNIRSLIVNVCGSLICVKQVKLFPGYSLAAHGEEKDARKDPQKPKTLASPSPFSLMILLFLRPLLPSLRRQ